MAAILASFSASSGITYGFDVPGLTEELNDLIFEWYNLNSFELKTFVTLSGGYSKWRVHATNRWPMIGSDQPSFFDDYYNRIHVQPPRIDLQTIASSQTRQATVWNAYPFVFANLDDILISQPQGIEIVGQAAPYSMLPLQELTYDITVSTSGPPNVDAEIQFNFNNVTNPLPIIVTGNRAVKFDIVPEVPVDEEWSWLTDNIRAVDGTEQRAALRGEVPRVVENLKVVFDSQAKLRKFYSDLLSCVGRLWIPEFQYATPSTAASSVGTVQLYYNKDNTDIREGEYALIQTPINSALVEIQTLNASGAIISSALTFDVPAGSLIMPGAPALINEGAGLSRYAVNEVGETTLSIKMIRQRTQLQRPGVTVTLPTFLGVLVMEKRPLADDLVEDVVFTGEESLDNSVGLPDIISRWDYSRIGGARSFKVNRIKQPEQMDYWKAVFSYSRGAARKFWMPTYRPDLKIAAIPADASASLIVEGTEYAEKVYGIKTHRYLEIETASGIHRTSVTSSIVSGANSTVGISPAMPTGAGWRDIKRISYLLPVRLGDDKIKWRHFGLESILELSIVTAEP